MRIFTFLLAALISLAPAFAMNDACQKEFGPIIQSHSGVMQEGSKLPKNQPKTFEQALANSNAHCSFLTKAQNSFARVQAWMKKNQDFCQVPESELNTVAQSLATITKNRTGACNSVATMNKNKSDAAKQQAIAAQQGADPFARPGAVKANDPFNPQIVRKPQLSLE